MSHSVVTVRLMVSEVASSDGWTSLLISLGELFYDLGAYHLTGTLGDSFDLVSMGRKTTFSVSPLLWRWEPVCKTVLCPAEIRQSRFCLSILWQERKEGSSSACQGPSELQAGG